MKGFHHWRGIALAAALLAGNAHAAIVVDLSFVDLQSVEYQRFKSFVDDAVAGNPGYGFSAADAAYMSAAGQT